MCVTKDPGLLELERQRLREKELDELMAAHGGPWKQPRTISEAFAEHKLQYSEPEPELPANVVWLRPRPRNTQQTSTGDDAA